MLSRTRRQLFTAIIAVTATHIYGFFAKAKVAQQKLPATLVSGEILSHLLGSVQLSRELEPPALMNDVIKWALPV